MPEVRGWKGKWVVTEKQVLAGMVWLDETVPGWVEKIDTEKLMMSSGPNCILGQVYGDYCTGLSMRTDTWAVRHGFDVPTSTRMGAFAEKYEALTKLWREKIRERRGGDEAVQ